MTTWKEFKDAVEAKGVTDDMRITWIDVGSCCDNPDVEISRDGPPATSADDEEKWKFNVGVDVNPLP